MKRLLAEQEVTKNKTKNLKIIDSFNNKTKKIIRKWRLKKNK